ncbi:hypothetical protein ABIB25_000356 [Nakamurella sp. UYEF19]|uniref:hypothetical protein n=1 Tax=Nakamurella sp. UYEF19 TaxID=1756392 RepID=UPI00339B3CE4
MTLATGAGRFAARHRALAAIVTVAALVLSGCAPAQAGPAEDTYGSLPTFLPVASIQPDSVLTGTTESPALTVQGDAVQVRLDGGSTVQATVSGPDVPGEGLPYETPSTTCTFTVTLTGATGAPTAIAVADFTTVDHLGTVYHPAVVPGSPAPPRTIAPGQAVSFQLRTVMITGEGLMRWAPGHPRIVASWDFVVEND